MAKVYLTEVSKVVVFLIIINLSFTLFLNAWVTDEDLHGIPKDPKDRLISLFYFSLTTFTTSGYGDIYSTSSRMKLVMCAFMIFVFSITVSFLFDF